MIFFLSFERFVGKYLRVLMLLTEFRWVFSCERYELDCLCPRYTQRVGKTKLIIPDNRVFGLFAVARNVHWDFCCHLNRDICRVEIFYRDIWRHTWMTLRNPIVFVQYIYNFETEYFSYPKIILIFQINVLGSRIIIFLCLRIFLDRKKCLWGELDIFLLELDKPSLSVPNISVRQFLFSIYILNALEIP